MAHTSVCITFIIGAAANTLPKRAPAPPSALPKLAEHGAIAIAFCLTGAPDLVVLFR